MPQKGPRTKPDEVLQSRAKKLPTKPGPELDNLPLTEVKELRRARKETEAACAKYADFYDFAPIGYFTFDPQGIILEANLTGARLLGAEPGSLLHTPFVSHVAPAFRQEFTAHLGQVFATQPRQICTLELATLEGAARHKRRPRSMVIAVKPSPT